MKSRGGGRINGGNRGSARKTPGRGNAPGIKARPVANAWRLEGIEWRSVRAAKRMYEEFKQILPSNPDELESVYSQKRLQVTAIVVGFILELKRQGFAIYGSYPMIGDKKGRKETRIEISRIVPPKKLGGEMKAELEKKLTAAAEKVLELSKELWCIKWLMQERAKAAEGSADDTKVIKQWKTDLEDVKTHPNSMPRALDEINIKLGRLFRKG